MGGREAREPPGVEPAGVHVEPAGEQDAAAADVDVTLRRDAGVPEVAGEFGVGGGGEEIALVRPDRRRARTEGPGGPPSRGGVATTSTGRVVAATTAGSCPTPEPAIETSSEWRAE
jgi:hypothetical protein